MARPGLAAERVAVFPVEGDPRLFTRLTAELRSQGFEVSEASVTPAPTGSEVFQALESAQHATGASVAIRIVSDAARMRIWITNAVTKKRLYRDVASEDGGRPDSAIAALWAVELLRASAIAPTQPDPVITSTPGPVLHPSSAHRPPAVALQVLPAVAFSPGGLGASAHVLISGRAQLSAHTGVELFALLPTLPSRLERTSGVAVVSRGVLAAGPYVATGTANARYSTQAAAGAALTVVRVNGVGAQSYQGQSDHFAGGGPFARVGAAMRLSRTLRLRADLLGGIVFPRPVIYFAEEQVASWGRPWLAAGLGGEAVF